MSLSQAGLQAVLSQSTEQCFLECLTISHPDMASDLLLVNDRQDLVRTAGTFSKAAFSIDGVRQDEEQLPALKITADNVDQRIITQVRSLAGSREKINVKYEVVLADTPNVVEYGPINFKVENISNNLMQIQLVCSFNRGFLNSAHPYLQFAPSNAG